MSIRRSFRLVSAQCSNSSGRPAGQAFLCDKLENGAGYCRFLSQPDEFQKLFAEANPSASNTIASKWLESSHAIQCDTSCNFCMRDYGNMPYHPILDWRLALDMVRIAREGFAVDLLTSWETNENPWQHSLKSVPKILERLGYGQPQDFGSLRGYVHTHRSKKVLLEVHPLWQKKHPIYQQAVTEIQGAIP